MQQQYLEAMGVRCYVPRYVLPAALPSRQTVRPAVNHDAVAAQPVAKSDPAPLEARSGSELIGEAERLLKREARGNARQALDGLLEGAPPEQPSVQTKPLREAVNEERDECRFKATVVDSGFGLRCVAESSAGPMPLAEKRLLANIARACHRELGVVAPLAMSAEDFNWPLLNIPGWQQDAVAAREALTARLARSEAVPLRCVLVFGQSLRPFVSDEVLTSNGVKLIVSEDLTALMADPRLKAHLWAELSSCNFNQ